MTSTWITRAPAASTSLTCSPRREKSADRIEGATRTSRRRSPVATVRSSQHTPSDGHEHRIPAVVALEDGRRGHAHDRRVLAAVGTDRGELEAVQAVDAAVAPGEVRGAQPRLGAVRAQRPEVDLLFRRGGMA